MQSNTTTGEDFSSVRSEPDAYNVPPASVSAASVLLSLDTTGYKSVTFQVTSPGTTCTITYEQSNDNITWVSCLATPIAAVGAAAIGSTSTVAGIFAIQALARWVRARVSTYTSGTVTANACLRKIETTPSSQVNGTISLAANSVVVPVASATVTNHLTNGRVMSAATTNATSVKATAGNLYAIHLFNTSAAVKFFKLYNKASAPVVGTDVPILTVPIAAGARADLEFSGIGMGFATGIAYAITGAVADTDTTAVALNDVVGSVSYL